MRLDRSCTGGRCRGCTTFACYCAKLQAQRCCSVWGEFWSFHTCQIPFALLSDVCASGFLLENTSSWHLFLTCIFWLLNLIQFFMDDCKNKLQVQLERKKESSNMLLTDHIAFNVGMWLEMNVLVTSKWAQLQSIQVSTTKQNSLVFPLVFLFSLLLQNV